MKTALLAVCAVLAGAAPGVLAQGPLGNGSGDGEANVPFATLETMPWQDVSGEVALHTPLANASGDGEANVPFASWDVNAEEEIGAAGGEPGRVEEAVAPVESAERTDEFLRHVWTDP